MKIGCSHDEERFLSIKPYNRFWAWKGRDEWHKDFSVQIRLEDDGSVFLSTQGIRTSGIATITLDRLYEIIKEEIEKTKSNAKKEEQ